MGMLTKMLGLKVAQKVVNRLEARSAAKDAELRAGYIPADRPLPPPRQAAVRGSMLQKAGTFYQQNPKLVASLASVLLAGVAAAVAKKRGMY